jgi:hypothetical protein
MPVLERKKTVASFFRFHIYIIFRTACGSKKLIHPNHSSDPAHR